MLPQRAHIIGQVNFQVNQLFISKLENYLLFTRTHRIFSLYIEFGGIFCLILEIFKQTKLSILSLKIKIDSPKKIRIFCLKNYVFYLKLYRIKIFV